MSERSKIIAAHKVRKPSIAMRREGIKQSYTDLAADIKATIMSPANIGLMIGGMILNAIKIKPVAAPQEKGLLSFFQKKAVPKLPGGGILDFALNLSKHPMISAMLVNSRKSWIQFQVATLVILAAKKGYDFYRKKQNQKALDLSIAQISENVKKKVKGKKSWFS